MTTLCREISARIISDGIKTAFKRSITRKRSFVTHLCSPTRELSAMDRRHFRSLMQGVDVLTDDGYDFIRDRKFYGDRCASTIGIVVG